MKGGTYLCDFVVLASGMDSIRQEHHEEALFRVDPERRAREASMAIARFRKIVAAGRVFGRNHPAERARGAADRLGLGEFRDGFGAQNAPPSSMASAKIATSPAVAKSPAWPATPPIA